MPGIIVLGLQWGDEGKGKVVDLLTPEMDAVVRFQGGANAGHTVIVGEKKVVLHLIPSGMLHENCNCVIGNGAVVDPQQLIDEMNQLRTAGYFNNREQLSVSHMAHMVLPYHKLMDKLRERMRGEDSIGTTGRGIGPAYEDKVVRRGLRMGDLLDMKIFRTKLESAMKAINKDMVSLGGEPLSVNDVLDEAEFWSNELRIYIKDTVSLVNEWLKANKRVLFEGAQGALLDIDHGTYPYVTSSNTTAGGACTGAGVAPTAISKVIGIVKAYTTRVGRGPFPTEVVGCEGEHMQGKGGEFGATTGRVRRCGWLDVAALRRAAMLNGVNEIVITKLDVMSGIEKIKYCVGYEIDGKVFEYLPVGMEEKVEPLYEEMDGWNADISKIRKFDDLPKEAKAYVASIEKAVGCKAVLLSVGGDRSACIKVGAA